jgi:hypothetical protein
MLIHVSFKFWLQIKRYKMQDEQGKHGEEVKVINNFGWINEWGKNSHKHN